MYHNIVIMVIDDEVEMLTLLDVIFRKQGFVVMTAQNGTAALHLLKSLTPNLVVVDIMMPGMDGFEVCDKIRSSRHTANTPVIIFSGRGDSRSHERALQAGANAYLSKNELPGLVKRARQLLNLETADCS